MNTYCATEILINATRVSESRQREVYEFVLNKDLQIVECIHVESLKEGLFHPLTQFLQLLPGVLFELQHVRVNPKLNNAEIINTLAHALENIGVKIYNTPPPRSHGSLLSAFRGNHPKCSLLF